LKALRIEPVHDLDVSVSANDLPHIIADSRNSGDLPVELSLMMDRILDFPQRDVEHAMLPRFQVDWLSPTTTIGELREMMAKGHTRYPVVEDDTPVGIVHLDDVLASLPKDNNDLPVSTIMKDASVIPTLMPLPDALSHLIRSKNQLACVIDEYGGFAGILTLEDLAAEIVGEITDEHDLETGDSVTPGGENVWLMDGDAPLDEVERAIGYELPRNEVETVSGLLIAELGALPVKGDSVTIVLPVDPADLVADVPLQRKLVVDILEVERYVPTQVRVWLVEEVMSEESR